MQKMYEAAGNDARDNLGQSTFETNDALKRKKLIWYPNNDEVSRGRNDDD